jgi:hypothetical protein
MSNLQNLAQYYNQASNDTLTPLQDDGKDHFGDADPKHAGFNFNPQHYIPQGQYNPNEQNNILSQLKSIRNDDKGREFKKRHDLARLDTSFNESFSNEFAISASTIDDSAIDAGTPAKSSKRERPRSHTPRPSNSFILYRREKHIEIMAQYKGVKTLNNNVISKIVANMWRQESPEVKAHFAELADEEKRAHMLKYPDYKYRPRKSVSKKSPARKGSISTPKVKTPHAHPQEVMINEIPFSNSPVNSLHRQMTGHSSIGYVLEPNGEFQPVPMLESRMIGAERTYDMMGIPQRYGSEFLQNEALLTPVDYNHSWVMGSSVNGVWDLCLDRKPFDHGQD